MLPLKKKQKKKKTIGMKNKFNNVKVHYMK